MEKSLDILFKLSLILGTLCFVMIFISDFGSPEFVVMVIATFINAVLAVISGIWIAKKRKKNE